MKKNLLLIIVFFIGSIGFTQEGLSKKEEGYFGKTVRIGGSPTYIWETNEWSEDHHYSETTINLNATFRLSKRFWVGVQAAPIFTRDRIGSTAVSKTYYMAGVFSQFDIYSDDGLRLYAETSLNSSDYCTCGDEAPNRFSNLLKWGGGAGVELLLNKQSAKNLWLELGFLNYVILNNISDKYNFTQYIIGLNYTFGKQKG